MANDKLTWVELRKAVAQMTDVSDKEIGQFLNALLDGIVVGLKQDNQVKIKGIGTFALKEVAPRKSVNIATGEEFVIEGYNKLTFNAEANLKESVEKRLEQPTTNEIVEELISDPLKKLGQQADEIVDILADLGQAVNVSHTSQKAEELNEVNEVEEPAEEEPAEKEVAEESIVEEPAEEEVVEEPTMEEPAEEEKVEEPTMEEPAEEEKVEEPIIKNAPTKSNCSWVCWTIVILLLLAIAGAGWYFRYPIQQWWQCMQDCQPTEMIEEETIIPNELEVEENATVEEEVVEVVPLAQQPREYVNFIGIERVGKDSRLAWIAYKYYAQKDLWVFIYEANRDVITHPARLRTGQHLRIPELDEKYRNLYDPELRQLVDSLAAEYLK